MKRKKRAFTLLEIMISILIITLITGAIGYNMRGTLEKGKVFRTEQGKQQLYDLLQLCVAEGQTVENVVKEPGKFLEKLGLAKDPAKLMVDGWGNKFDIQIIDNDFDIKSAGLENYKKNQG